MPVIERRHQLDVLRQQHAVAEHVPGHVADADDGEVILAGVHAESLEVELDRFPGTARGDAHLLVVVALGTAGGERVAQPETVAPGNLVGRVGERRRALVRGHHQVRVVTVMTDYPGGRHHLPGVQVVGDVQHRGDEHPVAGQHLTQVGLPGSGIGQPLADEAAFGAGRDDDGILHLLRLRQAEHLGAEILRPVRPAQAAARDVGESKVHALEPGRVDEELEPRPRERQVGHPGRVELGHEIRQRGLRPGPLLEVVGPQRGRDHAPVGPQDAVLVEAGDIIKLAADLLGDRLAPLALARAGVRVEPGLEEAHEQPGHRHVRAQHALDVVLAERRARLAQVPGVRAQHHHLPPGEMRVEHEGVESVVLDLPVPQRG